MADPMFYGKAFARRASFMRAMPMFVTPLTVFIARRFA